MKNKNQKSSSGVMLTQAQWERCDRLADENGYRSRNAFIREAIDFYCSWLEKEQCEVFLTPALESVISAKIRDTENRLARILFKMAVEQNVLTHYLVSDEEEVDLDELRLQAIQELKETGGTMSISDIISDE